MLCYVYTVYCIFSMYIFRFIFANAFLDGFHIQTDFPSRHVLSPGGHCIEQKIGAGGIRVSKESQGTDLKKPRWPVTSVTIVIPSDTVIERYVMELCWIM